jgi:hypothetical protein
LNRFTPSKSELAGVTAIFGITIVLFTPILNAPLSFSQGMSSDEIQNELKNSKKPHEQKPISLRATTDPFKFPIPLGGLDTDRSDLIDRAEDENSQHINNLRTPSNTIIEHSTIKATIIPDNKSLKNKTENPINGSFNINSKSVGLTQNNTTSINTTSSSLTGKNGSKTGQIYNLYLNSKSFPIRYRLTGSSNNLLNMTVQSNNPTLLLYLSSSSTGKLTIELGRNIIDSKNKDLRSDSPFAVFEDGRETSYAEIENNNLMRQISIPFNKGTSQIAIAGTYASPEYNATTALYGVSMCISIVIIIAFTRYKIRDSISHIRE